MADHEPRESGYDERLSVGGKARLNKCGAQNFGYDLNTSGIRIVEKIDPIEDLLRSAMADSAIIELDDGRRIPARYLEPVCS